MFGSNKNTLLRAYQVMPEKTKNLFILGLLFITALAINGLYDIHERIQHTAIQSYRDATTAEALAMRLKGMEGEEHGSAMLMVDKISKATGVQKFIKKIKPQSGTNGDSLFIEMHHSIYAKVVLFIEELVKNGMNVKNIKIRKVQDPGYVNVTLTIG